MSYSLHSSVPGVFMKTEIGIGVYNLKEVCPDECNGFKNRTQKPEKVMFSQASVCLQLWVGR